MTYCVDYIDYFLIDHVPIASLEEHHAEGKCCSRCRHIDIDCVTLLDLITGRLVAFPVGPQLINKE